MHVEITKSIFILYSVRFKHIPLPCGITIIIYVNLQKKIQYVGIGNYAAQQCLLSHSLYLQTRTST